MKRIYHYFLILFLFFWLKEVNAQKIEMGLNFSILTTPKFDVGINPSINYYLSQKISLLAETSLRVNIPQNDSTFSNSHFSKNKIELRYKFSKTSPFYIGIQIGYIVRKFDNLKSGNYFINSGFNSDSYSYSSASIKSNVFISTLQTGIISNISRKMKVEIFGGIGVRNINTNYSNIINNNKNTNYAYPKCGSFISNDAYLFNGFVKALQINFGIRLLYKIN